MQLRLKIERKQLWFLVFDHLTILLNEPILELNENLVRFLISIVPLLQHERFAHLLCFRQHHQEQPEDMIRIAISFGKSDTERTEHFVYVSAMYAAPRSIRIGLIDD